jgi:hypothetical protein
MDPTGPIARRFPLVARPRPACTPLEARVGELCTLAHSAEQENNQAAASAVFNQGALLASDVGLPDLARSWCHRHAEVYLQACPLGSWARYALEPLVNLARLHIRDGNGAAALQLLDTLYEAVCSRIDTVIDGLPVPAATLTSTDYEHRELRQWLWTVLLADGARALTSTGGWNDALTHLQQHNGVGQRMLDGRQVAVIALVTSGDLDGASALLSDTVPGDHRENAVTSCLTALCHRSPVEGAHQQVDAMLHHFRRLEPTSRLAIFHTRLALTIIDTAGVEHPGGREVADALIRQAIDDFRDGYVARELLAHQGCAGLLTHRQEHDLSETLDACGLGSRAMPRALQADLSAALDTSEATLTRALFIRSQSTCRSTLSSARQ